MRLTEVKVDARPVAFARIGLGIATIMNTGEMFVLLNAIAGGKLAFPVHDLIPSPTSAAVFVYAVLAVVAGLALTVGWHASAAAVVLTVLNVAVFFWDQQTYSGHRFLGTLLVAYLIFARSDAALSVSRRRGPVPWWPQLLMMTQLSVCYLFAAVSKINVDYLSGAPLSKWVLLSLPWWMFTLAACGSIVVELILAVGLWRASTRREAALLGVMLHLSIIILMKEQTLPLIAFALTCLCVYGLFFRRPPLPVVSGRKASEASA
jgi:hypothetical protein